MHAEFDSAIFGAIIKFSTQINTIIFSRLGNFRAKITNEIDDIVEINTNKILIKTNKASIYDSLPECLFHSPSAIYNNIKKQKESIIKQKNQEQDCRVFFLPIENVIDNFCSDIYCLRYFSLETYNQIFINQVLASFPELKIFTYKQILLYMKYMSCFSLQRTNLHRVAKIISKILDIKIGFSYLEPNALNYKNSHNTINYDINTCILNKYILGTLAYLKGPIDEKYPILLFTVYDIKESNIEDCLNGGILKKRIQYLLDELTPMFLKQVLLFNLRPMSYKVNSFSKQIRLGYNTYL